jgi:NAD(P)-dependent dehydrogenase (short-subunit alcohol dehydrogenase family)
MPSPTIHDDTYPAIASHNFSFKDEVALITGTYQCERVNEIGAGRGIGKATALAFAERGAHVALLSRTRAELEQTAAECDKFGIKTLVVPADMTDEDQVNEAVKKVWIQ